MKRPAVLLTVAFLATGCAMQQIEQMAKTACSGPGQQPFIVDAKHEGIPLVVDSASAMILCVGPDDVTHLPATFGADAVSTTNLRGVGIFAVAPGSAADKAGIKPSDVVYEFAGTPVAKVAELGVAIGRTAPGDRAAIKLRRKSKDVTVTAQF